MAKKNTQNRPTKEIKVEKTPEVKAPVKEPIKVTPPKAKADSKPAKRYKGTHLVHFISNGLSKYIRKAGKLHKLPADHAQLLVDKGYGKILDLEYEV